MHQKILGICAALVAFAAFAIVPAMASASPALTEGGSLLTNGSLIKAEGEETSQFASGFITVTCNKFSMTGSVTENTGSSIKGTITKASFENSTEPDCSSNIGATRVTIPAIEAGTSDWCIVANAGTGSDRGQVQPHACGGTGGEFTFVLNNTPGGTICRYKRTANINVSFNTNVTPATVKLVEETPFELEPTSSAFCSATGKLTKMNFNLVTDNEAATGLTIS
jgi:hypothetical protein